MQIPSTGISSSGREIQAPAELHVDTPEKKALYEASMEFERNFLSFMMKQMQAATKAISGEESSSGAIDVYNDMAQDQLTQAMLEGGGLGLASMLYKQLSGDDDSVVTSPDAATPSAAATPADAVGGLS